jgi:hypothetical protein
MKTIPVGHGQSAIVDDEDYDKLSKYKWYAHRRNSNTSYYASRVEYSNGRYTNIIMHRVITNAKSNMVVDHINGNGLDNRHENLRVCTRSENSRNCKKHCDNKSGYKGVHLRKDTKKWSAQIKIDSKVINLGKFDDAISAAKAYDEAAKKYHGNFASLNFP